jgi:hypothetical protein
MSLGGSVRKLRPWVALASLVVAACVGSAGLPGDAMVAARDVPADASGRATDGPADRSVPAPSPAPAAACAVDEDCRLVSDCCTCQAIPRDGKAPSCDPKRSCVTSVCAQYQGIDQARCAAGRCVLGFDCDTTTVVCKRLPPVCPTGQVPQVVGTQGARCYGECVDATQCLKVPPNAAREM